MKRKIVSCLVGTAMASLSLGATATPLSFDDVTTGNMAALGGYGGLEWSDNFYAAKASVLGGGYTAGLQSGAYVAFNAYSSAVSFSADDPFTFESAYLTAAWNDGLTLDIKGYLGSAEVQSLTLLLSATTPTFALLNWSNVDRVSFASHGGTHHAGYGGAGTAFVMDNLTLTPVPEAETYAMLLAGLGIMGVVARRRRTQEM